jgi:hypothetical protein
MYCIFSSTLKLRYLYVCISVPATTISATSQDRSMAMQITHLLDVRLVEAQLEDFVHADRDYNKTDGSDDGINGGGVC